MLQIVHQIDHPSGSGVIKSSVSTSQVKMDNPDITMNEYIRLETEKALRHEFPAIVYEDDLTYELEVSLKPTVSPHHAKQVDLEFEISFAEFDDEDCIVIYDKDSFSYKIISAHNLKSDTDNDDALVSDVVRILTSEAIQKYGLLRSLKNDLSALENTFTQIQGVLSDADEMKQTMQKDVEEWLRTLKSASLEAENVLDEAKTDAMIQRLHGEMGRKYKSKFKLTPNTTSKDDAGTGGENSNRETSSLVNLSNIYGRDTENKMMSSVSCLKVRVGIKLDLWTGISDLVDSMDGISITMGDFKVVRPLPFRVFGSVMRNSELSRSWPISVLSVWFTEPRVQRPVFSQLADLNVLNNEFAMDEIQKGVWDCADPKAQGPDAVKKLWDLLKNAFFVCAYIKHFESSGRLAKECNPSLISLVPEKKDPVEVHV
ncbi:disease resistance protein [Tanacetum coccineum]|uniref:Disease resistance protein n=1 Tax=Tanacetum coccineum TaxID=301880 RepID=A0ABQ4Y930_9ASTR